MTPPAPSSRLAGFYKRLRGSQLFVILLLSYILISGLLHFAIGFDPDWGVTNLALSLEASVGMSLFMMWSDRQEEMARKQMEYMLRLMEAQKALLEEQIIARRQQP